MLALTCSEDDFVSWAFLGGASNDLRPGRRILATMPVTLADAVALEETSPLTILPLVTRGRPACLLLLSTLRNT